MGRYLLHCLCLVTLLSRNLVNSTLKENEEPRRTFPVRRAIDGTRGRKYYVAEEDGLFDNYGSSRGQYDPYEEETDLSDIRNNVPGEPSVDYPAYPRLPQTGYVCEAHFRGYYADEEAGCQVFHVCNGNYLVSSFLCPIGSIFSQKLLTCDWWNKVDCSSTRNYHVTNSESTISESDDDEILRKAFEMDRVKSSAERIPTETTSHQQQQRHDERRNRILTYGNSVTERSNELLPTGQDNYSDYPDYPSRYTSRQKTTSGKRNRQRYQEEDYNSGKFNIGTQQRDSPAIRIHTIGEDRKNDREYSLINDYQPSYAPTVPTVTTTARKYYSPTIPTTYRPYIQRDNSGRYDLEFESSDHLYTARGRSPETVKAATPPTFVKKNHDKSVNFGLPKLINSGDEITREIEKTMKLENNDRKINLTIDQLRRNFTDQASTTNETLASLDEREKVIDRDLDRLVEKISETLSILTIDNENRDPAVFSYEQIEETSSDNSTKNFAEPSNVVDSTSFSFDLRGIEKPAEFLQPPPEIVSEFRIMVLDKNTSGSDELSRKPETTFEKESIEKNKTVTESLISPSGLSDEDIRESRIIRIFVNNNATDKKSTGNINDSQVDKNSTVDSRNSQININSIVDSKYSKINRNSTLDLKYLKINKNSTVDSNYSKINASSTVDSNYSKINENSTVDSKYSQINANTTRDTNKINSNYTGDSENPKISIEIFKSIDLSPKSIIDENNVTITRMRQNINKTSGLSNFNQSSGNSTASPKIGATSTIVNEVTEKMPISKFKDSIDIIPEDIIINESNVTTKSISTETTSTISPLENVDLRSIQSHVILVNESKIDDVIELGSSPFHVALSVNKNDEIVTNDDAIRKIIAREEIGDSIGAADYKSFEIVKSNEPKTSYPNTEKHLSHERTIFQNDPSINDEVYAENYQNFQSNRLQSTNYLRSIVALVNGPNLPRPFSLENPRDVEIKIPSDIDDELFFTRLPLVSQTYENTINFESTRAPFSTTETIVSSTKVASTNFEKSRETLEVASSGFPVTNNRGIFKQFIRTHGEKERNIDEDKLIFDLPEAKRIQDFEAGVPLRDSQESNTRFGEDGSVEKSNETMKEMKKTYEKTVVETEFIPSLGFSLNTDEEREEYMDAVVKGLLHDVEADETTNNQTKTSVES